MEMIEGKTTRRLCAPELALRQAGYQRTLVDLGTGDGRFILHAARQDSGLFAIGMDACRENLRDASRHAPLNTLFVISNALTIPKELYGLADQVTINFPWGSLLGALLIGDLDLINGLRWLMRPGARLEVRLNASALAESGWSLDSGARRVYQVLRDEGFPLRQPGRLDEVALRGFPTTWSKRLACSRLPEGSVIRS